MYPQTGTGCGAESCDAGSSAMRQSIWSGDVSVISYMAIATIIVHVLTGGRYGFHRDELATLEDARHLAWGDVAYPLLTPLLGRLSLQLFGISLAGFRLLAAPAEAAAVLTGLMVRELGGQRGAQLLAATAAVPFCLAGGQPAPTYQADRATWPVLARSYCLTPSCTLRSPYAK
jgi:hypothetical protein